MEMEIEKTCLSSFKKIDILENNTDISIDIPELGIKAKPARLQKLKRGFNLEFKGNISKEKMIKGFEAVLKIEENEYRAKIFFEYFRGNPLFEEEHENIFCTREISWGKETED